MGLFNARLHPRDALGRFVFAGTGRDSRGRPKRKRRSGASDALALNAGVGLAYAGVVYGGLYGGQALRGAQVGIRARGVANTMNSTRAATRGLSSALTAVKPNRAGVYNISSLKGRRV